MNIAIIDTPLHLLLHGFSGIAVHKDYAHTAFRLMDRMWQVVKGRTLPNKGINIWVYEPGDSVFAGVELTGEPPADAGLEQKQLRLQKYARFTHTGSYALIKQTGLQMREELSRMGYETGLPYVEIYGHWNADESKLETELLMSLV